MLVYFRLSKEGYGTVDEIEKWSARKVLQAINYETFCANYESAYLELSKDDHS